MRICYPTKKDDADLPVGQTPSQEWREASIRKSKTYPW